MTKKMPVSFSLLTLVYVLLSILICCNLVHASSTVFSDNFDDGDISDWTITTTGEAVFDVSTDKSVSAPYSVHMQSLTDSKGMGVSPTYTLDLDRNYDISLYFLIPHTNNHWFEVFNNHQIYLIIDYYDDLKYYDGTNSYLIKELATNQWYRIEIKAHQSSSSYDVYIDGSFEKTCSMWIHTGLENKFRVGDRADGSTDKGEAFWDSIFIYQESESPPPPVPEFPLGYTIEIMLIPILIYMFWKTREYQAKIK